MNMPRRHFLARAGGFALGFSGLSLAMSRGSMSWAMAEAPGAGYGPLVTDPAGVIDLPAGFTYHRFSMAGERMSDGLIVPGKHDAMAAFPGPDGLTILLRNHEIEPAHKTVGAFGSENELLGKVPAEKIYDLGKNGKPARGGVTTVVYDTRGGREQGVVVRDFLSLAGTERNCAGGATPRNTWITCEETVEMPDEHRAQRHGYCFEVPAGVEPGLVKAEPIKGMGRFMHEACATDPRTGVVYLTEDRHDGCVYRYVPKNPERLLEGGKLQALAIVDRPSLDTRNEDQPATVKPGERLMVTWIDIAEPDPDSDSLRETCFKAGAARFARGEGMWFANGQCYFACTTGGHKKLGQLWKLTPPESGLDRHAHVLELFLEPNDAAVLRNADNITAAPWGDLIVCEDASGPCRLLGVTPSGQVYVIARNPMADNAEFAGVCFSPDGSTLFVNIQNKPGATLAIRGPWRA